MNIIVNGESRTLPIGSSVADLVASLDLGGAPCAVEVNRNVVPKADHPTTTIGEGDSIEVVTLVGGG